MCFVSMYKSSSFETQTRKDLFARWINDVKQHCEKKKLDLVVDAKLASAVYKHLLDTEPLSGAYAHLSVHFPVNGCKLGALALGLHVCMED